MKFNRLLIFIFILTGGVIFSGCVKNSGIPGLPVINPENNLAVGASAKDLLTTSKSNLVIEIHYMPGFQLQPASINNLVGFLQTYLNKTGGIQVIEKQIPASTKDPLSVTDIAQIEKDNRTAYNTTSQVAVYVLVTNGNYTTSNALGVAYRNTSASLFGKLIHNNSGGLGQASRVKVESTVLYHEFGHLLGLVDTGSPMVTNHKDAGHGSHCDNNNCVMHYASQTTDILGLLITGNIPGLDQNCKNDLKANGGK